MRDLLQRRFRRQWTPTTVIAAAAAYLLFVLNVPFFSGLIAQSDTGTLADAAFVPAVAILLYAAYLAAMSAIATPYLLRPVLIVAILVTAGATYFMREYGIVIDDNMIRNAVETNQTEVRDLITPKLVLTLLAFGVLPAAIVGWVPIAWPPLRVLVRQNFRRAMTAMAIGACALALLFAPIISFFRENRPLLHKLAPSNVVEASIKFAKPKFEQVRGPIEVVAADAVKGEYWARTSRPAITVLVIGETARANHFGLNGYGKPTTPELAKVDHLINFGDVRSCGTDTAVSVPCIFSGLGRQRYASKTAGNRENLLDIAQRVGLQVLWRENQSGCKGVCMRVPTEKLTTSKNAKYCADGECHDEILLDGLKDRLRQMRNGGLVVLHMMGSHGPAYHKRYPSAFAAFLPACETSQFSHCTAEQISNSYDNTIRYSDYVLAKLIGDLKAVGDEGFDTTMIYVSDHGESLGEKGLYLHGMPYSIAPDEQVHVPMVMWLSQQYRESFGIETECVKAQAANSYSHDNIFHTTLAMLAIESSSVDAAKDILARCRAAPIAAGKLPPPHP